MRYSASLDSLAKFITFASIAGFLALIFEFSVSLLTQALDTSDTIIVTVGLLFFIFVPAFCFLFGPRGYLLTHDALCIQRPVGSKVFPYRDIEAVRPLSREDMKLNKRTLGVGGIFGYFGRFQNPALGSYRAYTTQRKNRILVTLKSGQYVVITPDNTDLVQDLAAKLD